MSRKCKNITDIYLRSRTSAWCYTKSAQISTLSTQADGSPNASMINYWSITKEHYSDAVQSWRSIVLVDNWCIETICKADNTHWWSIFGLMVPLSHEFTLQYCSQRYIEMDSVGVSKGCNFIQCKPQHCAIYRQGVMYVVHLVVDNRQCMLLAVFTHAAF